jgi:hypothetical protein
MTDWPTFVSGVVVGALSIATAVGIAWWQRVVQVHDRIADRESEATREREQAARVKRREVWGADYLDIRALLERGEEIAYRVRRDGRCTASDFDVLGVATLRMDSERLAGRGMQRLREPLLLLASKADELFRTAVQEHAALAAELSPTRLYHAQRLAVLQDRAARDVTEQIALAWRILREEWGS